MNDTQQQQALVTFRVGPVLCCAPSLPVEAIITPPALTHPPGSTTAQPGIFRHNRQLYKVVDLRYKFGVEPAHQTQPGRFVLTQLDDDFTAFWVDEILDVMQRPAEGWGSLPPHCPRGVFSRTLLLQKKIYLYADFEKLRTISGSGYLKQYIDQLHNLTTAPPGRVSEAVAHPMKAPTKPETGSANRSHPAVVVATAVNPVATAAAVTPPQNSPPHPTAVTTFATPATQRQATHNDHVAPGLAKTHTTGARLDRTDKPDTRTPAIRPSSTPAVFDASRSQPMTPTPRTKARPSAAPVPARSEPESVTSGWTATLMVLLLFAGAGSGIYYWVRQVTQPVQRVDYAGDHTTEPLQYSTPPPAVLSEPAISATDTEALTTSSAPATTTDAIEPATVADIPATPAATEQAVSETVVAPPDTAPSDPAYYAEISRQQQEITIVLHQPDDASPLKDDEPASTTALQPLPVASGTQPATEVSPVAQVPALGTQSSQPLPTLKPASREIIHVVVKGDTLWAIAKRYVNNPFRYPELARLSNIKNPHRIYPGDRVRIRFVKK